MTHAINVTVYYFADTRFPIERANGTQTMATCRALAARGHDVTLVVRPDTASVPRDPFVFYDEPRTTRLTFRTIPASGGPRTRRIRFLLEAAALVARRRGAVYTRDLGLAAFLLQAPVTRRARVIYESHGVADVVAAEQPALLGRPETTPTPRKLARLARREARVWARAAGYVAITQALATELTERFGPRDRVFVVPDGATARPIGTARSAPDAAVIGYAGHLYPWKGVDVLVHALALIPSARAIVVGGHPAETDAARIETLATTLGVRDRITLTGLVRPSEVATALAEATVLVLPNTASAISERYTSPLKLFEYLSMGRPIVASDLPAIREILTHDDTALLVPPGDPHALAAAVARLSDDARLAERIGSAAGAIAPAYTWDERARRLEAVLEAAVA